ncbi:hypothetical protein CEXT_774151 [Caerostris extrusa]|uniref:Uncharacterized protein n=1 Tax=Caerostris extrusa TaxID=172846 RepID=A0AAV4PJM4_CAEEX|nr:hypothetical protein CEXT_774151 [Caerostris extrusa]
MIHKKITSYLMKKQNTVLSLFLVINTVDAEFRQSLGSSFCCHGPCNCISFPLAVFVPFNYSVLWRLKGWGHIRLWRKKDNYAFVWRKKVIRCILEAIVSVWFLTMLFYSTIRYYFLPAVSGKLFHYAWV